jgi:hypothetical protein
MTLKGVDLVGTLLQRPSCMKLAFLVFSVALVVLLVPGLAAGADAQANGVYDVQVLSGGTWQTVAAPDFGLAYRTRTASCSTACHPRPSPVRPTLSRYGSCAPRTTT